MNSPLAQSVNLPASPGSGLDPGDRMRLDSAVSSRRPLLEVVGAWAGWAFLIITLRHWTKAFRPGRAAAAPRSPYAFRLTASEASAR